MPSHQSRPDSGHAAQVCCSSHVRSRSYSSRSANAASYSAISSEGDFSGPILLPCHRSLPGTRSRPATTQDASSPLAGVRQPGAAPPPHQPRAAAIVGKVCFPLVPVSSMYEPRHAAAHVQFGASHPEPGDPSLWYSPPCPHGAFSCGRAT